MEHIQTIAGILLLYSSSLKPIPQYNHGKNIRQIPIEGYSTKYLINTSPNIQDYQKQSQRNCHSQGKSETLQLNITWYPVWDSGTQQGHLSRV